MFEFKYYAKIDKAQQEAAPAGRRPVTEFNIEALGVDSPLKRMQARLFRWFMLAAFWLLRRLRPNLRIGRLVIVTREEDVRAVLANRDAFEVPFGREMAELCGASLVGGKWNGANFALGMDGQEHDDQRALFVAAYSRSKITDVLADTRQLTSDLIEGSGGKIDVLRDLVARVMTETCSKHFGLGLDDMNGFADRMMAISAMIFADPFGSKATRELALNGAEHIRSLIHRAIEQAKKRPRQDNLISHLVHNRGAAASPTDDEICAMVIGMATGFVPTTSLAAGKIIEELLRRPNAFKEAKFHAQAAEAARRSGNQQQLEDSRAALRRILLEAGRLNPALTAGQFRFSRQDGTIAEGTPRELKVPAGMVVLVATPSALRDKTQHGKPFPSPGSFRFDRTDLPDLMFGDASHKCVGIHQAIAQITEIFQILLALPNVRPSTSPVGWLSSIGPFPRRLDMMFDPKSGPAGQCMATIVAQLHKRPVNEFAALQMDVHTRFGNPANAEIRARLDGTGIVHFASMSVIDAGGDDAGRDGKVVPFLVLELNFDCEPDNGLPKDRERVRDKGLVAIAKALDGSGIEEIFRTHVVGAQNMSLAEAFVAYAITLRSRPAGATGLNFNGTPEFSVRDIEQQAALAEFSREALRLYLRREMTPGSRPTAVLDCVRSYVHPEKRDEQRKRIEKWDDEADKQRGLRLLDQAPAFQSFLTRPARRRLHISEWTERGTSKSLVSLVRSPPVLYMCALLFSIFAVISAAINLTQQTASAGADTAVILWDRDNVRLSLLGDTAVPMAILILAILYYLFILGIGMVSHGVTRVLRVVAHVAERLHYLVLVVAAAVAAGLGFATSCLLTALGLPSWVSYVAGVLAALPELVLLIGGGIWLIDRHEARLKRTGSLIRRAWNSLWTKLPLNQISVVIFLVVLIGGYFYTWFTGPFLTATSAGLLITALLFVTTFGALAGILRLKEATDSVDDRSPDFASLSAIAARENAPGHVQNHLIAVTQLKPGPFRKLTLATALWGIGRLVMHFYRPGFVLNMGTIHYAKWFRLPGTDKMIFLSNYDGSWESYLEDFITKAHKGQSAAWSNGVGFPRTRLLIFDGAHDGDRFKRWVRRQQVPTQFWYCRFPKLTTDEIRRNALIHDGLMRAKSETAAEAWLDCFGSMPRPEYAMESNEVQSLVFRGLPKLPHTIYAKVCLPNDPCKRRRWLRGLLGEDQAIGVGSVTFGDEPRLARSAPPERLATRQQRPKEALLAGTEQQSSATFVAFSSSGLARLGLPSASDPAGLAGFPGPFNFGMANRARILGDFGESAPETWGWTDMPVGNAQSPGRSSHAILLIYGDSIEKCRSALKAHADALGPGAVTPIVETRPAAGGFDHEHFGFRDGIAQPVIKGTQRYTQGARDADVVEPGEFILGYRNNHKYFPPSLIVRAETDPSNRLPVDVPGFASRFPQFRMARASTKRDFGRNGTFIVLRQLEQDVAGFRSLTESKAKELESHGNIEQIAGGPPTAAWVAAKMMGRWQDGVSLIERPVQTTETQKLGTAAAEATSQAQGQAETKSEPPPAPIPDNDFRFGTDDPQGMRCPFGAHIRRANPRDSLQPGDASQEIISNRHRLLRRGRTYGPPAPDGIVRDEEKRGIMFVGLCADIERQFEFLQQSWIGLPSFHGLSAEPDPIASTPDPTHPERNFSIPTPSGPIILRNMASYVTVRGGGYYFMPSRAAIGYLADLQR